MEIQQHDGMVVDAAAISTGLRQALREGEVSRREREAPRAWVRLPSLPPLYIGPLGGGGQGGGLPPKASGGAPTPRVSNPRRRGPKGGRTSPPGAGSSLTSAHGALRDRWPTRWTPGTLPMVPVQYR